ncbi:hypothetical protein RFI_39142, partial [Reticulomyxa filosa]
SVTKFQNYGQLDTKKKKHITRVNKKKTTYKQNGKVPFTKQLVKVNKDLLMTCFAQINTKFVFLLKGKFFLRCLYDNYSSIANHPSKFNAFFTIYLTAFEKFKILFEEKTNGATISCNRNKNVLL